MHNMMGKNSADDNLKYLYFSQKIGIDISCKLSHKETICMTCQILFSWKNKQEIINGHLLNCSLTAKG